nr:Rdx family protein [Psychromonas arctica]
MEVKYCKKCRWLMRAIVDDPRLLSTFENELDEVSLLSGEGGFPEITELKQLVRDVIPPDKDLGSIDRKTNKSVS